MFWDVLGKSAWPNVAGLKNTTLIPWNASVTLYGLEIE
jgi:hypothetical protein